MSAEVYCEPFLSLADTLAAAIDEGLRVDQYLELRWGCQGQAERIVAEMRTLCEFPNRPVVLEIGPGSGRFLYHTVAAFKPTRYEIYEPAADWSSWLDGVYSEVTEQCADGRSLSATKDGTCDLVVAHGVFVYLKMLSTLEYIVEIGRVLKPGGVAIFDVFTEKAFDVGLVRSWLETAERFPVVVPESLMLDICGQQGLKLIKTFRRRLGEGESQYFAFEKQ